MDPKHHLEHGSNAGRVLLDPYHRRWRDTIAPAVGRSLRAAIATSANVRASLGIRGTVSDVMQYDAV